MAIRRSTQMLLIGLAVFVIGAGVVLISLTGSKGDKNKGASATTTTTVVQAGTVVIPSATTPAGPTTFTIPEGKQAVAVQLPYVAGLAGYAKAGDTVNIYATLEKGTTGDVPPPSARLVLPSVEVLAVTGPGPGSDSGMPVYLLALDASQAEQAIFFSRFESMWMTLVPKGQPKAQTTGRSYKNAF